MQPVQIRVIRCHFCRGLFPVEQTLDFWQTSDEGEDILRHACEPCHFLIFEHEYAVGDEGEYFYSDDE